MYFFTADEHYYHYKILEYQPRPFKWVSEMHKAFIANHNAKVTKHDITVHAGDFSFGSCRNAKAIIKQLNGDHIFIRGNHDGWLPKSTRQIWEKVIENIRVIVCHYPLRSWNRSFHGSWNLHGHNHGRVVPFKNQYDIGVDTNNFTPVSFDELRKIMSEEEKTDSHNFRQAPKRDFRT